MPLAYRYLAKTVSRTGRASYRYAPRRSPGVVIPFRPRARFGFDPGRASWYRERFTRQALSQRPKG